MVHSQAVVTPSLLLPSAMPYYCVERILRDMWDRSAQHWTRNNLAVFSPSCTGSFSVLTHHRDTRTFLNEEEVLILRTSPQIMVLRLGNWPTTNCFQLRSGVGVEFIRNRRSLPAFFFFWGGETQRACAQFHFPHLLFILRAFGQLRDAYTYIFSVRLFLCTIISHLLFVVHESYFLDYLMVDITNFRTPYSRPSTFTVPPQLCS